MCKSLEMASAMMFYVPFMCFDFKVVSLLTRFQMIQRATVLCDSAFTGSNEASCI